MNPFRSLLVLTTAVALAFAAGCTSTKAQISRAEFALESEIKNRDNAEQLRKFAEHHLEQNIRADIAKLNAALDRAQRFAATDAPRTAQAIHAYYAELERLRTAVADERAKLASLNAEQIELGKGFRYLSHMADAEATIGKQTGALAISEALRVGDELWRQYQAANPPPSPPAPNAQGGASPKPPSGGNDGGGGGWTEEPLPPIE